MENTPQFRTATFHPEPVADTCKACQQPITGVYYRANTAMLCGGCTGQLQRQVPQDSHAAFVRGIIFGLGGFVLGLILYAGFTILTGIEIGFVSLAVGWLVGKAIITGSGGVGGRRYQISAVLLTYAAVSLAFIPILIHIAREHPEKFSRPTAKSSGQTAGSAAQRVHSPAGAESSNSTEASSSSADAAGPRMGRAEAIGRLVLVGLVSPFLRLSSGFSGLIGLVILAVGMQFAWKITRGVRLAITGPYPVPASAKA